MKYNFKRDGVMIAPFLTVKEIKFIRDKLSAHITSLLEVDIKSDLSTYHKWSSSCEHNRINALSAKNRHFHDSFWEPINLVEKIQNRIINIFPDLSLNLWDEGIGTTAYRLIRPGCDDGYPPSKKSWGPGGKLLSISIPIIGFTKFESQAFLLGSHLKHYGSYIPTEQKFCSDEKRLFNAHLYNFSYIDSNPGDIIIFHWNTIHSEQIIGNNITRLALEMRFLVNE